MKRALLVCACILALAEYLGAQSNLRILDVGLHGYLGTPTAVRLLLRNPSPQTQLIHLRVTETEGSGNINSVTSDLSLGGGEERQLELPVLIPGGAEITADATAAGAVIGHDRWTKPLRRHNLIVLMCVTDEVCKTTQSQIQFSGSIEDRADKNRGLAFEVVDDAREHWWAYSDAGSVVLAMPLAKLSPQQQKALEEYLRRGGRLVLVDREIADSAFLAAYRKAPPPPNGEPVGKGTLFRVGSTDGLGDVFAGKNLPRVLNPESNIFWYAYGQTTWLRSRFATTFNFPRLRWLLVWLVAYIVIIGVVNFVILRRLRLLEFGWISTCAVALVFAAGFYYSGASRRPKQFRLDNLAGYYLDAQSGLAAANYDLRVSSPERQNIVLSVSDPAVFVDSNVPNGEPSNSQIWVEMNRQATRATREYNIRLGPPQQVELPLLKWSFRDLDLQGLHEFPGTVHFVGPNRLRNDTGQKLLEPVYFDYDANAQYILPSLAPGEEIQLDRITPMPIRVKEVQQPWVPVRPDQRTATLSELSVAGAVPFAITGRVFSAFSDGPALPVELNVPYQQNVHSLIVVRLEQP